MMFEGMPWPLVLPIALMAMVYGVIMAKREINTQKSKKK